mgnify:CR=1 FL=1
MFLKNDTAYLNTSSSIRKCDKNHKVYIIRCWNEKEDFIKIGRTFRIFSQRFNKARMPYNYVILNTYNFNNNLACNSFEKKLHHKYLKYKYTPLISFIGNTECFLNNSILKEKNER